MEVNIKNLASSDTQGDTYKGRGPLNSIIRGGSGLTPLEAVVVVMAM